MMLKVGHPMSEVEIRDGFVKTYYSEIRDSLLHRYQIRLGAVSAAQPLKLHKFDWALE